MGDTERQPLAGQFTYFRNRDQRPPGITSLNPGEPSTAANRDTYFGTGNTYGALSKDSGMTWSHVNPFTLFPAADGGVCCDQRVLFDPGSGLTLWYVQYSYSATTQNGGFRLAWSRSRDTLRASSWSSVYLNAGSFGLVDNWLDFPDIAVSNGFVYIATNVFNAARAYQNSLVIRIALSNLVAGGSISAVFYRRTGGSGPMGGGASYRFTQTYSGAPSTAMYWASHNSTSSLRIFRWDDGSTARAADVDRTIPAWTSGAGSSVGPDGRDWIGNDDHRIATGYIVPDLSECAFLWTSNGNGGSRPQSYIRVQVFNPSDRSNRAQEDVFHSTIDFAYPAVGINSLGHAGVVFSGGSSTSSVTTFAMLVDNYFGTFAGNTVFSIGTSSNGAPSNRWGDYHSVVANPIDLRTFIGTGQMMTGGTSSANIVHRTMWFGRDDYTPAWASLTVNSTQVSGVPITVDEMDRSGLKNGSTPFTRSYTPQQGYTLRAPATFTSGANTYLFVNWTGSGGTNASTVYTVSSIGAGPHTATANYGLQTVITVDVRNVAASVPITVGTTDLDGLRNGTTRFSRRYRNTDGPFSFTAPTSVGSLVFNRWYLNSFAQPIGQATISSSPGFNAALIEAEYLTHFNGSFTAFCSGCPGTGARIPVHGGTGTPEIGNTVGYRVTDARAFSGGSLYLGASRTTHNGFPLPINLGFLGMGTSCLLCVSVDISLSFVTDAAGASTVNVPFPNDVNLIDGHVFTQMAIIDLGAGTSLPIVHSNALDTLIGGNR